MIILKIANMGEIKIELDYKNAPISSANFVSLVNKGFYDGLTFHRIIKGFMIQGGCPLGNGTGGPGYSIKGEFRSNGVNNQLSHKRGVISMARAMNPNSAGSQFFICDKDDLFLDGQYAAFGHVIEGMDVVDKIASVKTGYQDRPLNKVVIEKALSVEEPEPEFEKIK
jgi:peptidyl-prolyl cis-trans isomerase B (cyclophilin B)